jgi:hypothetical protein
MTRIFSGAKMILPNIPGAKAEVIQLALVPSWLSIQCTTRCYSCHPYSKKQGAEGLTKCNDSNSNSRAFLLIVLIINMINTSNNNNSTNSK